MSVEQKLHQLLAFNTLTIPKNAVRAETMKEVFANQFHDTGETWSVHCVHERHTPATDKEIGNVESNLGVTIPQDFRDFLRLSNGAKLFVLARKGQDQYFPGSRHVRYHIFGTSELTEINKKLFAEFRLCLGDDPGYENVLQSNYLAFCDAGDGNFLCILIEGAERGQVFFMDHETYYCPYSEAVSDLDYLLAPSFQEWLELVIMTGGWGGRGKMIGGI